MKGYKWKNLVAAGIISLSLCFQTSIADGAYKPANVKTVAGSGELGYQDGAATIAKFNGPSVAIEAGDGSFYVSDTENHRIRLVTKDNQVKTFAGTTSQTDEYGFAVGGFRDGNVGNAMFNEPKGLALSASGVLYVADAGNNAVRAIDNGVVHTVTSDLQGPSDIAITESGDLIVSDTLNHRIVKVTEQGEVSVLAGGRYRNDGDWLVGGYADGQGAAAQFNEPSGLAIAANGDIYVADTGNQRIRKIDSSGNVTTVAGTGAGKMTDTSYIVGGYADGDAARAQFNFPTGLAFDKEGNLYVADTLNHVIRVITTTGNVSTVAGIASESGNKIGSEFTAQFDRPSDVSVLKNGKLLVADQMNNKLRMIDWYQLPAGVGTSGDDIGVVYNNSSIQFDDAKPKMVNSRTLIPLRAVTETFGYEVDWNAETKGITIINGEQTVVLTVGDKNVKGTNTFTMDVAPEVEATTNRTYVPLRFIAEAFNLQVDWLGNERVVLIR
ncbi:NHL domain-containing protein [Calidifontibacillus oryziterrae]|uniref:NHL domain-containing protein n=1 Tax=Calidifontibacillus oryziterrae TaxID=1191699 RepID=UPI0002D69160|nr:stalk domain-containing protein [Calidifontibacillus oryziterrae]